MKYQVWHRTTYTYDEIVTDSLGVGYLAPRSMPSQNVTNHEVTVEPFPADFSQTVDLYGNTSTYFQVRTPHTELVVLSRSEVESVVPAQDDVALAQAWESCRPADRPDAADAWEATDFVLPSPQVAHAAVAHRYAAESLRPGRPVGEAVTELISRVHADFEYRVGATTVTTTVADVMAKRAGVCQDFAHLMLAGLRSHGLAVRYVSGYLATTPPPGKPRLVGADASHAWVAVWVPAADASSGGHWFAVDPTNDQWVDDRYVTVAWGREYGDVPPLKGVIHSDARKSTLKVEVEVATTD
jgi:transglutaminase-like putative cysteine protease